jgi:hypothetical protein
VSAREATALSRNSKEYSVQLVSDGLLVTQAAPSHLDVFVTCVRLLLRGIREPSRG